MDSFIPIAGLAATLYLALEIRRLLRHARSADDAVAFDRASGRGLRIRRDRRRRDRRRAGRRRSD